MIVLYLYNGRMNRLMMRCIARGTRKDSGRPTHQCRKWQWNGFERIRRTANSVPKMRNGFIASLPFSTWRQGNAVLDYCLLSASTVMPCRIVLWRVVTCRVLSCRVLFCRVVVYYRKNSTNWLHDKTGHDKTRQDGTPQNTKCHFGDYPSKISPSSYFTLSPVCSSYVEIQRSSRHFESYLYYDLLITTHYVCTSYSVRY